MAKFTPGPWSFDYEDDYYTFLYSKNKNIIIQTGDLSIEDARLIAAAPEMYEALRICLNGLRMWRAGYIYAENGRIAEFEKLLNKVDGDV